MVRNQIIPQVRHTVVPDKRNALQSSGLALPRTNLLAYFRGGVDTIGLSIKRYTLPAVTGTTYYVDPARPDDTGSGTSWATAKKTIAGAYSAAANGDTIVLGDGVHSPSGQGWGKSLLVIGNSRENCVINASDTSFCFQFYSGGSGSAFLNFTVKGVGGASRWIFENSSADNLLFGFFDVDETVLSRLIYQPAATTILATNFRAKGGSILFAAAGFLNINFAELYECGDGQSAVISSTGTGVTTINNSVIIGGNPTGATLRCTGGTLTANNCIIAAPGETTKHIPAVLQTGGTLTINDSYVLGPANQPHTLYSGTVVRNRVVENVRPEFVARGKVVGIVSLFTVDSNVTTGGVVIDPLQNGADRAGVHVTCFIDDQDHLEPAQEVRLRAFVAAGHDLGAEGVSSSDLAATEPCYVQYTGAETGCTLTIANSILTVTTNEGTDNFGPWSLVKGGPFSTLGDTLVQNINARTNFNSAVITANSSYDDSYSYCLADGVYDLSGGGQVNLSWDMDKYLTEEVTLSKAAVESLIGDGYVCKSYFYSQYTYSATARNYIKNAGFESAWYGQNGFVDLNSVSDIFAMSHEYQYGFGNFRGTGYDALDAVGKEARIRGAARALAEMVGRYGLWESILIPTPDLVITEDEVYWLCDELVKSGVMVLSFAEAVDYIKANGVATGDSYSIGLTQTYESKIESTSPCIGTGAKTALTGTTDLYDVAGIKIYDGTLQIPDGPFLDGVDIGAYAYVVGDKYFISLLGPDGAYYWPSAPAILDIVGVDNAVYDADGTGKEFATQELAIAAFASLANDTTIFSGPKGIAVYSVDSSANADRINRALGN